MTGLNACSRRLAGWQLLARLGPDRSHGRPHRPEPDPVLALPLTTESIPSIPPQAPKWCQNSVRYHSPPTPVAVAPDRQPVSPLTDKANRGYDQDKYRRLVRDLVVKPQTARRGTEHGSGLRTQRWVVERVFAHLHCFRRLRVRWETRDDIHGASLSLARRMICWRRLKKLGSR
ncbi:transposase [Streptomyces humi]|uniref:transposase n=1 Tax=Streptomyces humi TaxID=1428620 RepID=UPI003B846995